MSDTATPAIVMYTSAVCPYCIAAKNFLQSKGQTWTVDTGHMVAWTEGVQYAVRKVGGWKSTLFSGEGLVCDLTGPGRIYLQTRSPDDFLGWLADQPAFASASRVS